MTLIDKLKVPVLVAGLGLAGLVGCSKEEDISKINLDVVNNKGELTESSIDWLKTRNVDIDSAKAYNKRFLITEHLDGIRVLFQRGIMPGTANKYDERFGFREITDLYENGIGSEIANGYNNRFGVYAISNFYKEGVSPELANSYDPKIFRTSGDIINATSADLDNETALKYNERFSANERTDLYGNGVYPDIANAYHKSFSDADIIELHKREGISPKIANRYARLYEEYRLGIDANDIIRFVNNKVPFRVIEERIKQFNKSITE